MGAKLNTLAAVGLTIGAIEVVPGVVHDIESAIGFGHITPPAETFKPQPSWLSDLSYPGKVIVAQANSHEEEDIDASDGLISDVLSIVGSHAADSTFKVPITGQVQILESLNRPQTNKSTPSQPAWQLSWYRAPDKAGATGPPEYGVEAKVEASSFEVQIADPQCQEYGPKSPQAGQCEGSASTAAIEKVVPYLTAGLIIGAPELDGLGLLTRVLAGGAVGWLEKEVIGSAPDKAKTVLAATTAATTIMEHVCGPKVATRKIVTTGTRKALQAILQMNEGLNQGFPDTQQRQKAYAEALKLPLKIVLVNPDGTTHTGGNLPLTFSEPLTTNKDLEQEIGDGVKVSQPQKAYACTPTKQFNAQAGVGAKG